MSKEVFSVKGMHCSACVMTLEGLEDELAGIRSLKVSLHKQRAEIDYDEKKITEGRDPAGVRARGLRALPSLTL